MTAPAVLVSALQDGRLARDLAAFAPTHVVSLTDPSLAQNRVPEFAPHMKVFQRQFYDVEEDDPTGPAHQIVRDLVAFLQGWSEESADSRLICHCHMGASRSTAAAFTALAIHFGPGAEAAAFQAFLRVTNKPWPNLRMVALADEHLGRAGAMVAALVTYRRAHPQRIGAYHRLNARRGIFG